MDTTHGCLKWVACLQGSATATFVDNYAHELWPLELEESHLCRLESNFRQRWRHSLCTICIVDYSNIFIERPICFQARLKTYMQSSSWLWQHRVEQSHAYHAVREEVGMTHSCRHFLNSLGDVHCLYVYSCPDQCHPVQSSPPVTTLVRWLRKPIA